MWLPPQLPLCHRESLYHCFLPSASFCSSVFPLSCLLVSHQPAGGDALFQYTHAVYTCIPWSVLKFVLLLFCHFSFMPSHFPGSLHVPAPPRSVCYPPSIWISSFTVDISGEVTEVAGKVDLKCLWGLYLNPAGAVRKDSLEPKNTCLLFEIAHWTWCVWEVGAHLWNPPRFYSNS